MIQNVLKRCFLLIMAAITTAILYIIIIAVKIAVMEVMNEREVHREQ